VKIEGSAALITGAASGLGLATDRQLLDAEAKVVLAGLGGTVWTTDQERGLAIARQVRTGTIGVNTYGLDFHSPFGGRRASGLGRELGPEGLSAYLEWKSVYLRS
jgi:aldehyde dehydrogenase (NAD+)